MILNKQNISDWGGTLTPREQQMAHLKSEGKSTSFLACFFGISKCRVYQILNDIKGKMDAAAKDWWDDYSGLREMLSSMPSSLNFEQRDTIRRELSCGATPGVETDDDENEPQDWSFFGGDTMPSIGYYRKYHTRGPACQDFDE
jgi:hypothetical protein